MKNDLTREQLQQEVTVVLPLSAILQLNEPEAIVGRLETLKRDAPAIGEKGMYGIYAGTARGYNGEADGILEVLDEAPSALTWPEALQWAESLAARLPTRKEQALLFANVPELFKPEAYWSSEQTADDERWAWYQYFNYGYQTCSLKGSKLRARAVRRLSI